MIFLKINCPNLSRLVWHCYTKFQIGMVVAIPAIRLLLPHACLCWRRFRERLEMSYRLDAERFSSSALSRVKFMRKSERHSVEASVVEDSLTMNKQTDDNSVCHSYIAHITVR